MRGGEIIFAEFIRVMEEVTTFLVEVMALVAEVITFSGRGHGPDGGGPHVLGGGGI